MGVPLPAWLEPHREKFTEFVNIAIRNGWEVSEPHWQRCHVRFGEKGVVLVFKSGHEQPQNAERLTRAQRLHFWRTVQKWVALEKANRDKSSKSGRSNRNINYVKPMRADFTFTVTTDLWTRDGTDPTHEELERIAESFNDSLALTAEVHQRNLVVIAHGCEPTGYQLYGQE